jgi:hypothetical protein
MQLYILELKTDLTKHNELLTSDIRELITKNEKLLNFLHQKYDRV